MAVKVENFSEKTIKKTTYILMLSMLGFLGFIAVLFLTGNATSVEVIFNTLSSNVMSAFENLITLNLSAVFDQWLDGVLSLLILAALGLPVLLFPSKK
ncbi:hypothetical protein [Acinetobacter gandensis]|uniref:hypothetical protein n=1 Tax=Acinetobacter gandensis TaxID=1443941 RepID=UPI003988E64A